jgi:hypothetical protein
MDNPLFIEPVNKQTPILLIDASGSTIGNKFGNHSVLDQIKYVIKNLPEEQFRIIWWNSDKEKPYDSEDKFKKGICKLPFVVKKNTIDQTFLFIKPSIKNYCLTFPHLGFENISDDWISQIDRTKIYFITDGEIGYNDIDMFALSNLRNKLSESIINLFKKYNKIELNIITVEPKIMNFNQIETLNSAAGCDVYDVIMNNKLTKYISKFISFTLNNLDGFIHINKNIPPPGYVPYGDKYFSELRTNDFVQYIMNIITTISTNDDELLKIIQLLSSTINTLIKDKPPNVKKDIINTFCGLFNATSLDMMFVKFIITDAIEKEREGTANVFATYRAKLQDLYKQANELLFTNVKDSIGIGEKFISLPLDNKIIMGNSKLIDTAINLNGKTYPYSAFMVNGIIIPVIPCDMKYSSLMNEQCLRQWVRQLINKIYGVNIMEDVVIYVVLGIVLRIVVSDISETVKESYRKLGHIMLKKKRMNSDVTELERLEQGELPIPNSGKIEGFYRFMEIVGVQLNLKLEHMTLWYLMCLALKNNALIKNQFQHCKDSIEKDFPGISTMDLLGMIKIENVTLHEIPHELALDFNCLITLENTEMTGGYAFLPHKSVSGMTCHPVYVLSEVGYNGLLKDAPMCPICYKSIKTTDFIKIGPKPNESLEIFDKDITNIFNSNYKSPITVIPKIEKKSNSIKLNSRQSALLIIMKGTVGAGKSTLSMRLKEEYEKLGKTCYVEGTDKYCKNGDTIQIAIGKVTENLMTINDLAEDVSVVVIIDCCNETVSNKTIDIFGIDFTGWKRKNVWPNFEKNKLEGYLAWSLRNVLDRPAPTYDSNYWLNPEKAGTLKCVEIHTKKARAHFGKKLPKLFIGSVPSSKEEILKLINAKADAYAEILLNTMPMENQIMRIIGI